MIIKKELIDASINAKNAAKEAKDKAIAESVLGLVKKMKKLPPIIKDIMDTFFYVQKSDEAIGSLMWKAMCTEDERDRNHPEPHLAGGERPLLPGRESVLGA